MRYQRDMRGYGANPPDPKWPGGAHVACSSCVNYEEGGENCVLHGDAASEAFLSEIVGAAPWPGSATGTWNRSTNTARAPASGGCTACSPRPKSRSPSMASRPRCPLARPGRRDAGSRLGDRLARAEMDRLPRLRRRRTSAATWTRPSGCTPKSPASARPAGTPAAPRSTPCSLVAEEGGFDYISDTYDDDLPYWLDHDGHGTRSRRSSSSPIRSTPTTCASPRRRASTPATSSSPI